MTQDALPRLINGVRACHFTELLADFETTESVPVSVTLYGLEQLDGDLHRVTCIGRKYQAPLGAAVLRLIELTEWQRRLCSWWRPWNWRRSYDRARVHMAIERLEANLDSVAVLEWGEPVLEWGERV